MNKITAKINSMLERYNKLCLSPMSINAGYCAIFANELKRAFPRGKVMWGEDYAKFFVTDVSPDGHCFFKYGKKYYDSESENGVDVPDKLQFYQRILSLSEKWKPFENELDKIEVVC
jgi:hypothetical protein